MHDCSRVENRIVDLIFGELSEDEQLRLKNEINDCSDCLSEYRSINGAMCLFDEAWDASLPDESYWLQHHEALRQHLLDNAPRASANSAPFWRRLLTFKLPVPVPVAALIVIALLTLSALALRNRTTAPNLTIAAQPLHETQTPAQVIEVPVYREKVVTHTVYVERKVQEKNASRSKPSDLERVAQPLTANKKKEDELFMRANLTDFQPPDQMRIRVIKRSKDDAN
ncbi:MAG TPA: hypothetical protein VKB86_18575 [Pyrinomonadaceae bacterium]|nr:hypothetical protein [Pyrinomonadaceae bacterium]